MKCIKIPAPMSGGVMLSYQCSSACRHCLFACSPSCPDDWLSAAELEQLLLGLKTRIIPAPQGESAVNINYGLHFTGGEPFLNFDRLMQGVTLARQLRIPSVLVETNCSWGVDDVLVEDRLTRLQQAGLKGILISVNPYYLEHVPFERTERCARIGKSLFGSNVLIYRPDFFLLFRQMGLSQKVAPEALERLIKKPDFRIDLLLSGRAVLRLKHFYPAHPADYFVNQPCQPNFLRRWHNHFDVYGNFIPGCCAGISLGHWADLDKLEHEGVNIREHPILGFLLLGNMRGLVEFGKARGYEEVADGYISKCDLCLSLRRHLAAVGDFPELQPVLFYQQLAQQDQELI